METVAAKRIEIIADGPLVPRIAAACRTAGITGHSVTPILSGEGRSGGWREDAITGAQSKVVVLVVASPTSAAALVDALTPVLDSHRLLLTITEVEVVRAHRFG